MAAQSRVDISFDPKVIGDINDLAFMIAAGFDNKQVDRALSAAALYTAKQMVNPVKRAAVGSKGGGSGRLRRAIWAQPAMKDKPGAYVGIRAGSSRADTRGAYYRWIITSGVRNVPFVIKPKRGGGLRFGDKVRTSVTRTSVIPGNPFVSRTVDENMDKVKRMFGDALASIIQKGIPKRGRIRVTIPKPR